MVGTAQGTGTGGLKIRGSLDTSMIQRGFERVKQGFASVKGFAKSFTADLQRMSNATQGVVKWLRRMAIVGGIAIIGLASKAPAVAPALAKMSVEIGKLQRSLGEALAPAFERVAGWLAKFTSWVGENKVPIGEIAGAMLDWAEKIGNFLAPALAGIGQWATDHPKFFAALLGGLILAPAALTGITAIKGLLSVFTGTIVSASVLTALGYIALIAGAGYGLAKGVEYVAGKTEEFLTERAEQIPGTLQSLATVDQSAAEIAAQGFQPTRGGMISAWKEEDRRAFLLSWWDALWG